jgi:hypothetical protein
MHLPPIDLDQLERRDLPLEQTQERRQRVQAMPLQEIANPTACIEEKNGTRRMIVDRDAPQNLSGLIGREEDDHRNGKHRRPQKHQAEQSDQAAEQRVRQHGPEDHR